MRRFTLAASAYAAVCLIVTALILIHGDGPHPRIVSVYPPNGDRYWPGGTAQIAFSQPMDHASVERALQVSPGTQGQGTWFGSILNLQPVGDWRPEVTYHVLLSGTVTDELGRPLRTPVSFWFHVHHVRRLGLCAAGGIRNVCEPLPSGPRPLTHAPTPVLQFALSPDGSLLAYIRRDASGLPHLFITGVDGTDARQLTRGARYADSTPWWGPGDNNSVTYRRRPVQRHGSVIRLGKPEIWNIQVDGSANVRL